MVKATYAKIFLPKKSNLITFICSMRLLANLHFTAVIRMAEQIVAWNFIYETFLVYFGLVIFLLQRYEIFFRETVPPREVIYKGTILLIHGQSFSSLTWLENSTMQVILKYWVLHEFSHILLLISPGKF